MSEFVITVHPRSPRRIGRVADVVDRLGERHNDQRTMDVAFDLLVAAKGRYPISKVQKHICQSDDATSSNNCINLILAG